MPIIKSAKKRVKVAQNANLRNYRTKREMREAIKEFSKAIASGNAKKITEAQSAAVSAVDAAAKKDVIHKNKAARVKSRLAAQAKAAGAKPAKAAPAKPAAKKAAAKPKAAKPAPKAPPKKAAAKKPAAKKSTK
jgi:small subunit ribosomal protein S20